MILLIIAIGFALWAAAAFFLSNRNAYDDYAGAFVITCLCGVICLIFLIGITISTNYDIRKVNEGITTKVNQQKICVERKNVLLIQYTSMLDSNYGSYEKGVYDRITNANKGSNVNVSVYPEIKYSQTIIELSNRLQEQTDAIYQYTLDIEKDKLYLRTIKYSPWVLKIFLRNTE